jgi:hypothetical protein
MPYFQAKNPHLGKFGRDLHWKMLVHVFYGNLVYFVAIWSILRPFGIYIVAIWYILWTFGLLYGHLVNLWPFGIVCGHLLSGLLYGHLVYLWLFGIFSPVFGRCTKKNLATLSVVHRRTCSSCPQVASRRLSRSSRAAGWPDWAIFCYFLGDFSHWAFFEKNRSSPICCATFLRGTSYALI